MTAAIVGLILIFAFALLLSAPLTWLLMLFLGNLGVNIGFWGCVPGALVIGALRGTGVGRAE